MAQFAALGVRYFVTRFCAAIQRSSASHSRDYLVLFMTDDAFGSLGVGFKRPVVGRDEHAEIRGLIEHPRVHVDHEQAS